MNQTGKQRHSHLCGCSGVEHEYILWIKEVLKVVQKAYINNYDKIELPDSKHILEICEMLLVKFPENGDYDDYKSIALECWGVYSSQVWIKKHQRLIQIVSKFIIIPIEIGIFFGILKPTFYEEVVRMLNEKVEYGKF